MITALKFKHVNWTILLSMHRPIFFFFLSWQLNLITLLSLATGTEYVRSRLAEYANDLLSLGIDGLRLDAAKSKGGLDKTES
jgi:glycosidase